ncbi:MAG: hypothetical protein JWM80_5311 [Cyanobacteria bacterium RYN_339]|nr:hypothetical protein [Cyanobacteria bacterium RYN_339]
MSEPRRHHYLPQFYLAGFTPRGSKDDHLQVLDLQTGKTWRAKPASVAHQNDYYRLDDGAPDPFALEKGLANFEGQAADALKGVLGEKQIGDFERRVVLVNFIALMALRVPSQRNILADFKKRTSVMLMQTMVSTPEVWERVKARAHADGVNVGDVSYERMRDFAMDTSRYTIELSREALIQTIFGPLDKIIPLLLERRWSIAIAAAGAGAFVCCDTPVARHWTIDDHPPFVPGFGLKHSHIVFPLDRRTALLGTWDGDEEVFEADRVQVATINSHILASADRFVIYSDEDYSWYTKDGRIAGPSELIEWYKSRPKKRRVEHHP